MYGPWEEVDGHWFIDVGVELLLENKAIVWKAGCASTIMEHLGFSDAEIDSAFSNKHLFEEDITQHLIEIWYMQAYTMDKSLTYHPEGGKFAKYITAMQAMFCEDGIPSSFTQNLLDSYLDARDLIDVAARLEIHVPFQYATQVLLDFPKEVFLETTLVFPRELWWNVRIIRLHSAQNMFICNQQFDRFSFAIFVLNIGILSVFILDMDTFEYLHLKVPTSFTILAFVQASLS
ncbi:hypothetical protein M378DRAFT_16246 [Amanita muscaria Koide BX008]|uniref:Uncharacterized protein n=1 Tax=Amanita muscaria (strain Koide BX008) TaxID=946122 RepID=A0A0C2W8G2_AMAMK|nr:hypothetical protein M378DRAFT_16246 [Amanita muscaria Koide BX008]